MSLLIVMPNQSVADLAAEVDRVKAQGVLIVGGSPASSLELLHQLHIAWKQVNFPVGVVGSISELAWSNGPSKFSCKAVLSRLCAAYENQRTPSPRRPRRFSVDLRAREVISGNVRSTCSPMELRLFTWFLRYPGIVFSREELLRRISSSETVPDSRIVDVFVKRIRAKIEIDPNAPSHLVTVRGIGYIFRHNSDIFLDSLTRNPFAPWPCCP